jgi:hypothetical protein
MHGQQAESHGKKAAISDGLKRAAVLWGIGRNLYDLGETKVPLYSGQADQNAPKDRIVWHGKPPNRQWCVAPSVRELQRDRLSVEDVVRCIEPARARRLERIKEVGARAGFDTTTLVGAFEAASAVWTADFSAEPEKRIYTVESHGASHPTTASEGQLRVGSRKLVEWFEASTIIDRMKAYAEWKLAPAPSSTGQPADANLPQHAHGTHEFVMGCVFPSCTDQPACRASGKCEQIPFRRSPQQGHPDPHANVDRDAPDGHDEYGKL